MSCKKSKCRIVLTNFVTESNELIGGLLKSAFSLNSEKFRGWELALGQRVEGNMSRSYNKVKTVKDPETQ